MADMIVNSNKESALFQSVAKRLTSDLYSYHLYENAPNSSKSVVTISPQTAPSGTIAGATILFRIPKYGLIERMLLESTLTSSGNETTATRFTDLGYRVFSDVRLQAHGKVICSADEHYITARCMTTHKERAEAFVQVANYVDTAFSSSAVQVFTPVPFFFQNAKHMALDSTFVEDLELQCTVNSLTGMGVSALTVGVFKLHIYYRALSNEADAAYKSANFPMSEPLNMLINDSYTERQTLTNGATSTTITLKCPNLVSALHFFMTDTTNIGLDMTSVVSAITLKASGRDILTSLPAQALWFDGGFHNVGGSGRSAVGVHTVPSGAGKVLSIYFGEHGDDRTWNSGAAAFSNLNNVQLTLSHVDAANTTTQLVVVSEYWKILSVSPSDGRIDVGYSL